MYLSAHLSIDPSQLTKIEAIVPTKTFKKFLFILTGGTGAKRVEKETFNAVSILQQFQSVFEEMKIDNMVRLSQDEIDLYVDREGAEGDLIDAISKYDLGKHEVMSEQFQTLHLILEHDDEYFKYWVKIKICKTHEVGEYPIIVEVNGLFKEFEDKTREELIPLLEPIFKDQRTYDSFVMAKRNKFNEFIEKISENVKKYVHIDDIIIKQTKKIIVPRRHLDCCDDIRIQNYASDPVFHSYFGGDKSLFYTFLWVEMAKKFNLRFKDLLVYSIEGDVVDEVIGEFIDCNEYDFFCIEKDYDRVMLKAADDFRKKIAERKLEAHQGGVKGWFDFGEKPEEDDWY